jgi:hypothetical protein
MCERLANHKEGLHYVDNQVRINEMLFREIRIYSNEIVQLFIVKNF